MYLLVEKITRIVILIYVRFVKSCVILADELIQIVVVISEFFTVALGYLGYISVCLGRFRERLISPYA